MTDMELALGKSYIMENKRLRSEVDSLYGEVKAVKRLLAGMQVLVIVLTAAFTYAVQYIP